MNLADPLLKLILLKRVGHDPLLGHLLIRHPLHNGVPVLALARVAHRLPSIPLLLVHIVDEILKERILIQPLFALVQPDAAPLLDVVDVSGGVGPLFLLYFELLAALAAALLARLALPLVLLLVDGFVDGFVVVIVLFKITV